jgi:hypothetical protein
MTNGNLDTFKSNIKEQYENAKKKLISTNIIFNISDVNLENEYNNVIKLMDKESLNCHQGKSHYAILTSTETKEKKLQSELHTISDNFLKKTDILTNPKYETAIEEELSLYNQQKALDALNETNKLMLANNVVFAGNPQIVSHLGGGISWF